MVLLTIGTGVEETIANVTYRRVKPIRSEKFYRMFRAVDSHRPSSLLWAQMFDLAENHS